MVGRSTRQSKDFNSFVAASEPPLRRALVAAYGPEVGRDATADALGWAWEHWGEVTEMGNATGYLYRVGQTSARKLFNHRSAEGPQGDLVSSTSPPWIEPSLLRAFETLTEQQRVAVVLCHAFQWTHREVADLLGISPSSVQNHVERGLAKLRSELGAPAQ